MIKIIYYVHGTTTDNEENLSSGWKDVELSELGIEQSKKLRESTKDENFDVVFCSDLKRAKKTVEIAFPNNKVIVDSRLRECNYGDYNGKSSEIVEPLQEKNIQERFPNGESYEDVKKRIKELLEEIKKNYEEKKIAFVSHKAPQLAMDVLLKGMGWKEAFNKDWRKTKSWKPGWEYELR